MRSSRSERAQDAAVASTPAHTTARSRPDRTVDRAPRRVLIVSADIGEGHNATGRALEEAARRSWPGCEVVWIDTLAALRGGPASRTFYTANLRYTPWLYEFFYSRLSRHRWFATASKWVVAQWVGRALARPVAAAAPDVVLSTYPMGSGGLSWLRRRGCVPVPVGAWISDFAPHTFWIYPDLDLHLVMHEYGVRAALGAEPDAAVAAVTTPPAVRAFRPRDAAADRNALGLRQDACCVLVSSGAYAVGAVGEAVDTLLDLEDPRLQVVVTCGRNDRLRAQMVRRGASADRLRVLGWTDRMPELMAACDAVVTSAGGATGLEAVASGRTVVLFRPIAGHGGPTARAMAAAGVATVCETPGQLRDTVRAMLDAPPSGPGPHSAAAQRRAGGTEADLERLLAAGRAGGHHPRWPDRDQPDRLSSADALFWYNDTPSVPQHIGALVIMTPARTPVTADAVRRAVAERARALPWLTWTLADSRWRRPRWRAGTCDDRSLPVVEGPGDVAPAADVDRFFARRLDLSVSAWEAEVTTRGDVTALLVKVHHAMGDAFAVLDGFGGLLAARSSTTDIALGSSHIGSRGAPHRLDGTPPSPNSQAARAVGSVERAWTAARAGTRVVRGLATLVAAGPAPRSALAGRRSSGLPCRHAFVELDARHVRTAARALGCRTSELLIAVVAEALHRFLADRGRLPRGGRVRAIVPRTVRGSQDAAAGTGIPGNRTAAVAVDLPVATMPIAERVRRTSAALRRSIARGQPEATAAVLRVAGLLPAPVHAPLARLLYRSTWFSLIVSIIPGPRSGRWFGDARVNRAFPVVPLATGVGIAVGVLRWDEMFAVGITWDPGIVDDGERLAEQLRRACAVAAAAVS